jgi:hypothetical protein
MFFYYEDGRGTWAVRNDDRVLLGRFGTREEAIAFIASYRPR